MAVHETREVYSDNKNIVVTSVFDGTTHQDGQCYDIDVADLHTFARLRFQSQAHVGLTNECLIVIVKDRLGILDKRVPSYNNTRAIHHLGEALKALEDRVIERVELGSNEQQIR